MLKIEQYQPLREVVFENIRSAIQSGELRPGERLMEVQLAESLGVSRTPVREAIRKLEKAGLVTISPRRGVYVAEISLEDTENILEIRGCLEGKAAELAATRISKEEQEALAICLQAFISYMDNNQMKEAMKKDVEFHRIIRQASRNQQLIQILEDLSEQVNRFRMVYLNDAAEAPSLPEEHTRILNAFIKGDPNETRRAMISHMKSVKSLILEGARQYKKMRNEE
ncbi:GntR family transcriptional regulator [Gottschalkiaceae bacterium SANA]|nr:GntR family transcriptional regulator [Gottschalkiaceae bacterium SANA]